jgi:hypothetical protein
MTTNDKLDEKKPGEKEPGKHHYNPVNMSGKKAGDTEEGSKQEKNVEKVHSREELEKRD